MKKFILRVSKKKAIKGIQLITLLTLFFISVLTIPVFAGTVNVEPITNTITGFGESLKGFASPIFFVMIVISGIAMMTGQSGRQWAKTTLLFSAVGLFLVFAATSITAQLSTQFAM